MSSWAPERRAKHVAMLKARHADPEFKRRMAAASSERMKALNKTPEFRERLKKINGNPEIVAARAARLRVLNADPEFRAASAARGREQFLTLNADSAFREKSINRTRAMHADPTFKARSSARMRALNADPEFKKESAIRGAEQLRKLRADPLFVKKQSEATKAYSARPEVKATNGARMKARHADPSFAARHSVWSARTMNRLNDDHEFKVRVARGNRGRRINRGPAIAKRSSIALEDIAPLVNLRSTTGGQQE